MKQVPRYLINTNQNLVQPQNLAKSVKKPEADLDEIISFKNGKYQVRYLDGDTDSLTWRQLREGRPLHETPLEKAYWDTQHSTAYNTYRGNTINSLIAQRHEGEEDIWKYYDEN